MADIITAPINYAVIANGKFVSGGSVVFGVANVKPDADNPATLKTIYTDPNLLIEAENPQPLDSNGVFDQTTNGVLYGVDSDTYSIVVLDNNGAELSYMPVYDLSDANAATTAQQAASDAMAAETGAINAQAAAELAESNTGALYTDFVNRYFGAFSSDPTVDDQGNPPNEGSLYWNTVSNRFKVYDSGVWIFPEDLGLGTAAYSDIQTSPTDLTPDRVLITDSLNADGDIWGASNITSGSNSDGEFWQYPNGVMICTGSISLAVNLSAVVDGTNFSDQLTMTFPSAFISAPEVGGRGSVPGRIAWMTPDAITNTGVILRLFANTAVTGMAEAGYIAIGKWK